MRQPHNDSNDLQTSSLEIDAEAVIAALMAASRAVVELTESSVSAVSGGVTLAQYRTLVALATEGPQNHGVLADSLALHPSTMTRMCDRLIARDLIIRIPSTRSRREVTIALSPRGAELVDQVVTRRRLLLEQIVLRLDPADRAAAFRALREIAIGPVQATTEAPNARQ
jgi:DNA-binding MarR family transcriptional regulator